MSKKSEFSYMNFRVDPEFHRQFKIHALMSDMSQKEWLEFCVKAGEAMLIKNKM